MVYEKTGFDKETGLFNKELKLAFLDDWCGEELSEEEKEQGEKNYSRDLYLKLLKSAAKMETDLNKDLFEFNHPEIQKLLINYEATTIKSLNTVLSVIRRYTKWISATGKAPGLIMFIDNFKKDDLLKYLDRPNKYISREELFDILDEVTNAQDAVIPALIFEGIKGLNNIEICNLKQDDIDFDKQLVYVKDENGKVERIVKVSQKTLDLIREANAQTDYNKRVTDPNNPPKSFSKPLADNDYIIRQAERKEGANRKGVDPNDPVTWQVINTRIKRVAMEANRPYLTTTTIFQSGMLYRLYDIEQEKGELDIEDFKRVWAEFGGKPESYYTLKETYYASFLGIEKK